MPDHVSGVPAPAVAARIISRCVLDAFIGAEAAAMGGSRRQERGDGSDSAHRRRRSGQHEMTLRTGRSPAGLHPSPSPGVLRGRPATPAPSCRHPAPSTPHRSPETRDIVNRGRCRGVNPARPGPPPRPRRPGSARRGSGPPPRRWRPASMARAMGVSHPARDPGKAGATRCAAARHLLPPHPGSGVRHLRCASRVVAAARLNIRPSAAARPSSRHAPPPRALSARLRDGLGGPSRRSARRGTGLWAARTVNGAERWTTTTISEAITGR